MQGLDELRARFFRFFTERGHVVVPPSSLIPEDPSVLLTTAGMQQFKPYYLGERNPEKDIHASLGRPLGGARATSIQPCVRTSDIEEVGDPTHLTFFEMLGNFAFQGAYFKREAIAYAWEFLVEELEIPKERFWVTVFSGDATVPRDEESLLFWQELGIPEERIWALGREDNFWGPTGAEGPCGPTSEIVYDRTGVACSRGSDCAPDCSCGRFVELWNLVFNEYFCDTSGTLTKLSAKGVDTGMGFERLALVMFSAPDVFTTPFFSETLSWIVAQSPVFPEEARQELIHHRAAQAVEAAAVSGGEAAVRSARIVADHLRTSVFLLEAGVLPSNTDRGYILRRLIRRAVLHANILQLPVTWVEALLERTAAPYALSYPALAAAQKSTLAAFQEEAARFSRGLTRGLREMEKLVGERRKERKALSGADLFRLLETYGFPLEMSRELAREKGATVDEQDLEAVREQHRTRSRAGIERKFGGHGLLLNTGELKAANKEELGKATRLHTATHMLQAALRQILGLEVEQRGSDVTAERLRFDFSFPRKVTPDEVKAVENLVKEKIREDLPVERKEMPFRDAVASGALAFAKGAYPETVSVYRIPGFSAEVCGGPHVARTAEVGEFRIVKEEASAAGVRRIRAVVL